MADEDKYYMHVELFPRSFAVAIKKNPDSNEEQWFFRMDPDIDDIRKIFKDSEMFSVQIQKEDFWFLTTKGLIEWEDLKYYEVLG